MTTDTNRIQNGIDKTREVFAMLDAEKIAKVDAGLAVDFEEHFAYQQLQAAAHADGRLRYDEAQTVYVALGEVGSSTNGGWATGTDTATKYAVTLLVQKLLKEQIGARA